MRAIIPVAGVGSRLKPHTHTIPKVLLTVGHKPMLGHIIDKIISEGINNATFVYGHLGEMIIGYVKEHYPNLNADFVEQKEPEGLGHAIYTAIPTFDEKEILIILGDTIFDVDLNPIFNKKITSLGVKSVDDPRRFGVAVMKNGFIKELIEKPQQIVSNLALVGLYYVVNSDLLSSCLKKIVDTNLRTRGEFQLTDALQMMITKGEKITTFDVEGWYDCGKPETLLATNQYLLTRNGSITELKGAVINPPVFIAENAKIENCVIGPFTTIGEGVQVSDSIIKNSIIGSNAIVEKSILENSIIGNNSIIKGTYKKLNTGDSSELEFY